VQLDLFDRPPVVTILDPRRHVGDRTQVRHLCRVEFAVPATVHLVYDDRHGWYCAAHGRDCLAVAAAQRAIGA
jgi:hypothetical protein